MYTIVIEADISNMEILDLNNAVSVALANSPDMENVTVRRITVEKDD